MSPDGLCRVLQCDRLLFRITEELNTIFLFCAGEVNVGGIVAGVVVLLIVLGLVIFGVWFAYTRGFFSSK